MDPVAEIKARLPIEDLVSQYCQLQKKGRTLKALCPFHNDTHPSLTVSPDKGIAYCFACQTGGDIFSFYQAIEGVDFRQALKDLAEKTGVELKDMPARDSAKKDEKERLRECLNAALKLYRKQLKKDEKTHEYLKSRSVTGQQAAEFELGAAPASFSDTYEHLLKEGFSRSEIVKAGLGVQKELRDGKIYDRFRNRLMFPIHDHQGSLVGFGGRTLGDDDAKYINSSEGPLYSKSRNLYNLHRAKDAIRESRSAVMVEGYFDVLACHRSGVENVVAVSGTALTEEHVKLLKRYAETVVLCLDQDRAGEQAAERAFQLCTPEGLAVHAVDLPAKDPDALAERQPKLLRQLLRDGGVPYLDLVLERLRDQPNLQSVEGKRSCMQRLSPLLHALPTAVEREHYTGLLAPMLGTTQTALLDDLLRSRESFSAPPTRVDALPPPAGGPCSAHELTLVLLVLYPKLRHLLDRLIPSEDGFGKELYEALKNAGESKESMGENLALSQETGERLAILLLFCEEHELSRWSLSLAEREIRKNCLRANRDFIAHKQKELMQRMVRAQSAGSADEQQVLNAQYQEVLKLAKLAVQ